MQFGLIVFGDELLSGKRVDAHLPKLIELLAERGAELAWARFVRDDPPAQAAALRAALTSGDVVFCCGGIGATPDDHTRQAAAAALGRELLIHPGARELIWGRIQEMAAEQGQAADAEHPDSLRRFEMGRFPAGAELIPNPYNRIPGFFVGTVYFVPGFPVMAHPMMEWVLDQRHADLHRATGVRERSLIVSGAMEATLTPLMERIEAEHAGIKVFSLPSVDHPQWGRHIELGVKAGPELGEPALLQAYEALKTGLIQFGALIRTELVR